MGDHEAPLHNMLGAEIRASVKEAFASVAASKTQHVFVLKMIINGAFEKHKTIFKDHNFLNQLAQCPEIIGDPEAAKPILKKYFQSVDAADAAGNLAILAHNTVEKLQNLAAGFEAIKTRVRYDPFRPESFQEVLNSLEQAFVRLLSSDSFFDSISQKESQARAKKDAEKAAVKKVLNTDFPAFRTFMNSIQATNESTKIKTRGSSNAKVRYLPRHFFVSDPEDGEVRLLHCHHAPHDNVPCPARQVVETTKRKKPKKTA
uniref:Uncharacterized protein n=1 Tax=Mycena chlorophos TaxID=658473 RepID=A0ABQ0LJE4_MYCCL|nr:predicted protein [Mycena chlorophos]